MARHPGALVISLDFELRWGVFDLYPPDGGAYRENLLGVRQAIPAMLDLFEQYGIAATWATVGLLFAENRAQAARFFPPVRPAWRNASLDPYSQQVGDDEQGDPLHYAPSLIAEIAQRPRQEIGSHTFGHYTPLEEGSDPASFRADLLSAVGIGRLHGIESRALVFPRNQFNPAYAPIIQELGFGVCRTNANGWLYREADGARYFRADIRAGRLVDNYVPLTGNQMFDWDDIPFLGDLCLLPASYFLRPYTPSLRHLEGVRFRRIAAGIRSAAERGGVYHLWWHPHNFGANLAENIAFLGGLLDVYAECHQRHGMVSLSMSGAADVARDIGMLAAA